MRQWDIFDFPFPHPMGLHPAVILSPDEATLNPDIKKVNVLVVTTVRPDYRPQRYEVMLNGADGLDHLSRVKVLPVLVVDKAEVGRKRGTLSSTRQKVAAKKIREVYRLD